MEQDIVCCVASAEDIDDLVRSRLDTLRDVNKLGTDYRFSNEFVDACRQYFLEGSHTTVLARDGDRVVGCASLCYVRLMPTASHPTGKRAHLMNVHTDEAYRRRGIASRMLTMLIDEAWRCGATQITLDATEDGRPLYQRHGFRDSAEGMVLDRP